ncbi:MAG TPA: hypothetical protein VH640_16900 [Bryobacteraceae bacterium]|jgi:hypothetical protein
MNLRLFELLLRLYPREHRELFGEEMASVLQQAAEDRRGEGWWAYARFFFWEIIGLAAGAAAVWAARFAGKSRVQPQAEPTGLSEIEEIERKIQRSIDCMVHAIAHHQFAQARCYSTVERELRARLDNLRGGLSE